MAQIEKDFPLLTEAQRITIQTELGDAARITRHTDKVLLAAGEPGDSLFFVMEGTVQFEDMFASRQPIRFKSVGKGGYYGEVAAFYSGARSVTVRSIDAVVLYELKAEQQDEFFRKHPDILLTVAQGMAYRLYHVNKDLRAVPVRGDRKPDEARWIDQIVHGFAAVLGSLWFLGAFLCGMWWYYQKTIADANFDSGFAHMALGLSVVQIVIGTLVLNSQNRAAAREQRVSDDARDATFQAEAEIRHLHQKLDDFQTTLNTILAEKEAKA
jgi:hypothetical protein